MIRKDNAMDSTIYKPRNEDVGIKDTIAPQQRSKVLIGEEANERHQM